MVDGRIVCGPDTFKERGLQRLWCGGVGVRGLFAGASYPAPSRKGLVNKSKRIWSLSTPPPCNCLWLPLGRHYYWFCGAVLPQTYSVVQGTEGMGGTLARSQQALMSMGKERLLRVW